VTRNRVWRAVGRPARVSAGRRGAWLLPVLIALLAGCSSTRSPSGGAPAAPRAEPGQPAAPGARRGGGYYLDDGPGGCREADVSTTADAVPRQEPLNPRTMRPYVVFDRQYVPMTTLAPYRERGVATWYGRRYHGQRTSSGEVYDMCAMTAAHPTLPIPSYVRVTELGGGRSVVVRVNDRGPFLHGRLIDLSYTAAARLGYVAAGSAEVEVELITQFGAGPVLAQAGGATAPQAAGAATGPAPAPAPAPERLELETVITTEPGRPAVPAPASTAVYLQLGAFSSREAAEALRTRIGRAADAPAPGVEVRQDGALFKVFAGPYRSRADAQAAAERLRAAGAGAPFTVVR
jgi:rare lipoprotein A